MASICKRCRIGLAPTGESLCAVCQKRGRRKKGTKKSPATRTQSRANTVTNTSTTTGNNALCPKCGVRMKLPKNGNFPRHKDSKTGKACPGSGNYHPSAAPEKKRKRQQGGSVWAIPSGLPGLGRR